jgi:hypothetical protein
VQSARPATIAGNRVDRRAEFGVFERQIDLDQHVDVRPASPPPGRRASADRRCQSRESRPTRRRLSGLVRLQVADEVPPQSGIGDCAIFCRASWTLFSPKSIARRRRRP